MLHYQAEEESGGGGLECVQFNETLSGPNAHDMTPHTHTQSMWVSPMSLSFLIKCELRVNLLGEWRYGGAVNGSV